MKLPIVYNKLKTSWYLQIQQKPPKSEVLSLPTSKTLILHCQSTKIRERSKANNTSPIPANKFYPNQWCRCCCWLALPQLQGLAVNTLDQMTWQTQNL